MTPGKPSARIPEGISSNFMTVNDIRLRYLEAGSGEVVLMIHGFPTSSYLWRNVMPKIAETHRAIAIDLPGYGKSDKPLDVSYSLNFYCDLLSGFMSGLGVEKINLVVHDLGGPIGVLWALRNQDKLHRLALLNTLVYPDFSWAVLLFTLAVKAPVLNHWLSSKRGIAAAMRIGVWNKDRLTASLLNNYQSPFATRDARSALLKSASNFSINAFKEMEAKLPELKVPVRAIYGENDRILPKVARTMTRIKQDVPHTQVTSLPNCGHFLQEDEPEKIGELLSAFMVN